MPRDDAPEVMLGRGRALPNDEPIEIVRHITDELARFAVEHDSRRFNPLGLPSLRKADKTP